MFCGAIAALLADADVLLGDATDPIVAQELHRHFTHALIFVPFGALLVAAAGLPFRRRAGSFRARWIAACAGLATAGLLDACTGFGTHLLWPFDDARIAWNVVSIVDPLFTLGLLAATALAFLRRAPRYCVFALLGGLIYLSLGVVQRERAEGAVAALAAVRGHVPERVLARPSFGNLLLWRGLYRHGDHWYVDAVRPGPRGVTFVSGDRMRALDPEALERLARMRGAKPEDLLRFWRLTGGVVALDDAERLIDARYSMLPNGTRAMWGLVFEAAESGPDCPAGLSWFTDRSMTPADRRAFLDMLTGADGGSIHSAR